MALVTPLAFTLNASELISIDESSTPTANDIDSEPVWLSVNAPPPDKPSPAVNVIVESSIPANADTCADEDTIPEPSKSICPCANSTSVLPPLPRIVNFLASVS